MAGTRSLSTRHIPTLLGLLILGVGLVGGILLVNNSNTNTFLPRASPETTPKQAKITNVTDTGFTVSWLTDSKTPGYIRYGTTAGNLTTTITDDRDQTSGTVGQFQTHHVTIRSLQANTTYYFKIGTGTQELYDDSGKPYQIKTASSGNGAARTLYGEVVASSGIAADGALIYVTSDTLSPLSTLSQSTGSWVLSLASARTKDLQSSPSLSESTVLSLLVLSPTDSSTSVVTTTLSESQPVPEITLGVNSNFTNTATPPPQESSGTNSTSLQSKFTSQLLSPPTESTGGTALTISYPAKDNEVITSARPQLFGNAPKNTSVSVSLQGASPQTKTLNTGTKGSWNYTPTTLTKGGYTLSVSATINGTKQTLVRTFTIDVSQTGTPAFTASGSAKTPTPTPRVAASATSSSEISDPSTASGELVAGSMEYTIGLLIISGLFVLSGTYLFVQNKES